LITKYFNRDNYCGKILLTEGFNLFNKNLPSVSCFFKCLRYPERTVLAARRTNWNEEQEVGKSLPDE
jgi:hypothetical protein